MTRGLFWIERLLNVPDGLIPLMHSLSSRGMLGERCTTLLSAAPRPAVVTYAEGHLPSTFRDTSMLCFLDLHSLAHIPQPLATASSVFGGGRGWRGYIYTNAQTNTYVCVYLYIYIYIEMCIYTHICTDRPQAQSSLLELGISASQISLTALDSLDFRQQTSKQPNNQRTIWVRKQL